MAFLKFEADVTGLCTKLFSLLNDYKEIKFCIFKLDHRHRKLENLSAQLMCNVHLATL